MPIPNYPEDPKTDEEKSIAARYGKCLGSAVNRSCAKATPTAAPPRRQELRPQEPALHG